MDEFIDVFKQSECSEFYRKYRPEWSEEFMRSLIAYSTGNDEKSNQLMDLAIDVGCGTVQSTRPLAPFFKKVIGVDISETQLENARTLENQNNVEYRHGSADKIPVPDKCVDILTGCAVLHWILNEDMCMEIDRVLKPGGWFIFYGCYTSKMKIEFVDKSINGNQVTESYNRLTCMLYGSIRRTLVDSLGQEFYEPVSHYADIKNNLEYMNYNTQTNLAGLIGLIKSYSAYWVYMKEHPDHQDPVEEFQHKIMDIVNNDLSSEDVQLILTFPFWMRCGRKPYSEN